MDYTIIDSHIKDIKTIEQTGTLFDEFIKVRNQTIEIVSPLEIEDYVVQTEAFMSPPRWHIGHLTWFYDQLLRKFFDGYKPLRQNFDFYRIDKTLLKNLILIFIFYKLNTGDKNDRYTQWSAWKFNRR